MPGALIEIDRRGQATRVQIIVDSDREPAKSHTAGVSARQLKTVQSVRASSR